MVLMHRNPLVLALMALSLLIMACPAPVKVDGGTGGGGGASGCVDDTDCPDPQLFFCNTTTSMCEPSCRSKTDCTNRGQYTLDYCNTGLGCQCDEGKCVGSLCSADVDCGSNSVCRSGACVTAPAASTITSCMLSPDFVVLKPGATAKFYVGAFDATNTPVVVSAGDIAWAATSGSPLGSPAEATGFTSHFTAGATPTAGTAAVSAVEVTIGSTKCQAKAIVLPPAPAANQVFAVVTDELSGRPIAGIDVVLSNTDGSIIQQGAPATDSVKTDERGLATLTLTGAPASYSVTAFGPDHAYVTIANYSGTSRYLSIVTRRNQVDKYGGYQGTFKNVPATSNVHVGLAGMSLAGSITSLSLSQLLGPSVPTDVKIGSAVNAMGVKIPAGVFLGFGDQKIKNNIAGQGLAGVCFKPSGEADEAAIATGSCGIRSSWALAGDVPLGDLPIDAVSGGVDNINIGQLLSRILPIFKKFNSSVVRDVKFTLKTTPQVDGGYVFSDQSQFTTADHDFTQVPLAFSFAAKLPDLPKFRGAYVDGAAIVGGSFVGGRGVIPLGIGVGVNTDTNAQVDKQGNYASAGLVQVRMAPNHHGLEGSTYGLLVAAISAKAINDPSAGFGASAIFARVPGNKLVFDLAGTSPIDVSNLSFPSFPDGAKFNYSNTALPALPARSFRMVNATPIDFSGVNVIRVSFADGSEHHWDIVADPATIAAGFTLPKPPGTAADRLFTNGISSGSRSALVVQALRLNTTPGVEGGTAVSFLNFVEMSSTNAERTTELLTGFSFLDFGAPSVKFTAPKDNPATLTKGAKISIEASKFKIGTAPEADGVIKLTFTAAGAPVAVCPDQVFNAETTAGSGTVDYTLPATCVGDNLVLRAELMRADGTTPIAPAVWSTVTVTSIK